MSFLIDASSAIATSLDANTFSIDPLTIGYDYESRLPDASLVDDEINVRVVVPRTYDTVVRHTQNDIVYVAAFDIDVRKKFGPVAQGASSPDVPKSELESLTDLVEEIHLYFHDNGPDIGGGGEISWLSERNDFGVESKILIAYSPKFLREQRMFYGVCREFFMQVK